jgi:hypothetical protein
MFVLTESRLASLKQHLTRLLFPWWPKTLQMQQFQVKAKAQELIQGQAASSRKNLPPWYSTVPASRFSAVCHKRVDLVTKEVDSFFLDRWPFPSEKARQKFIGSDFTRNMCYNYPEALDSRIGLACQLITLLFLVDGKRSTPTEPHPSHVRT